MSRPPSQSAPGTARQTPQNQTGTVSKAEPVPTRLWLVRHAEVEARYHNVFGGRIDMELSPRGHQQAQALARYFRGKAFDAVYASPMKRVRQTLSCLLADAGPKPVLCEELREVDFGDWTGLHWAQVQSKYGISALNWLDQMECAGIANGECARALRDRLEPCLREILRQHSAQNVALVCHGGVIRGLLAILLELPLAKMAAFEIDYASVTQVAWTPQRVRLHLVNFAPWRDMAE